MESTRINYSTHICIINDETIRFVWLVQSLGLWHKKAKAVLCELLLLSLSFCWKQMPSLYCVVAASSGDCWLVVSFFFFFKWVKMLSVSVVLILSFLWSCNHLDNVFVLSIINETVVFFIVQVFSVPFISLHPLIHTDTHTGLSIACRKGLPNPTVEFTFWQSAAVKLISFWGSTSWIL